MHIEVFVRYTDSITLFEMYQEIRQMNLLSEECVGEYGWLDMW